MNTKVSLILGGARSGKTGHAEQLVAESGLNPIYLATGTAKDKEMHQRIERHKSDRAKSRLNWQTVEEPTDLANKVSALAQPGNAILVDCLTLWLSNCLGEGIWPERRQEFLDTIKQLIDTSSGRLEPTEPSLADCEIILVSNETGLGVVPMGELSRQFVDESGFLHQDLAGVAQVVTLVVAGIPTQLKTTI